MSASPYISSDPAHLLHDLNPAQREAVTHGGRALLVVAGAGTGKTRALTRRVAWLITQGVAPQGVLAITFTNKAADELKRRLVELPGGGWVWAGTFHGFGAFLLRRHGDLLGIDPRFTILDRDDQLSILKAIYKDLDVDKGLVRPVDALAMISHRKNGGGGRAPLDLTLPDIGFAVDRLYDAYVERLRGADLLDFDDLLLEAVRLLEEQVDVAALYRRRFVHVLVDEYQDTNLVQRDLLKALVGPTQHITVVGDPDQSIYRWRGAVVRNILDFGDDFEGAEQVLLERNYRSTANILGAAEAVIGRNRERHAKRLFTEREAGRPVLVTRSRDGEDEGRAIAAQIRAWVGEGRRHDEIAVFYRINALSRGIELALNDAGIPYVVVAGTEFFQRREVKDVLSYARLIANPRDEAAFTRIVNVPRRGVGAASLQRLREHAQRHDLALTEAARLAEASGMSKRARGGLTSLLRLLERARAMPRAPVAPILEALLEGSGYRDALRDTGDDLDRSRLENVDELVAYAREFDRKEVAGDLQAFLERAALVSDQDGFVGGTGRVSLMSVHAAKGLEFPCVAITGAEMGYFPHARSLGEDAGEEEERRLFYVAMTRAQDALCISHAVRRQTYMGEEHRAPSPYLLDIPEACLERRDLATHGGVGVHFVTRAGGYPSAPADDVDVVRETGLGFEVGERVLHPYFGVGRLESVGGGGSDARVTVDFDRHGRKQLLLRHARLERFP